MKKTLRFLGLVFAMVIIMCPEEVFGLLVYAYFQLFGEGK